MIFVSHSPEETKEIAKKILKKFKGINVFLLEGELGGGKTTFVKGVADFFLIKEKIKSPTFVIMRRYPILNTPKLLNLYHFDCYRIKDSKEILELGWQEAVKNPKNLFFVEWGDKIKNILPKNTLHLKFEFLKEHERKIIIK